MTYDQEPKEIFTNTNVTDAETYAETDSGMGLNDNANPKKVITGTQDGPSALTSKTGGTQADPSELTSIAGDYKKSSNMTPDK